MRDREFIKKLKVTEVDEEEIKKYEAQSTIDSNKLIERRQSITNKISIENLNRCNEIVQKKLKEGEQIIYKFKSTVSAWKYMMKYLTFRWVNGKYAIPQLGTSYVIYITNERIIFFEVDGIYRIMETRIADFKDVMKFQHKCKKDFIVLDFKLKSIKKDDDELVAGWINNRMIMYVKVSNIEEICRYLDKVLNKNN
ncbi:hypothetical protein [Clostridium ganghwense]|uniref:YokE-like PH domain-containing protein n=1 Tax=Clostridium ganghwense TaxID=312089 RepID=A0ABT4CQ33_9CLOT|nr:hypothetical protein [Clostridium ganghwense]MCY6371167.1 hypothetical protein [Clostridium ganghwense]